MSKIILRETLAVRPNIEVNPNSLKDQVVAIQRVTKVVKGGKNLSFSALVVVGDQNGNAGFGMGKAREVPMAIRKAIEQAKKNLIHLNLKGTTIPHQVLGLYGSGQVMLKPAPEGTGIIAGGPVRAGMEVRGMNWGGGGGGPPRHSRDDPEGAAPGSRGRVRWCGLYFYAARWV